MKTLIAYKTKLGSSKKYATWLAESLRAEVVDFDKAGQINWTEIPRLVVISGTYGGRMPLTKFLKENWGQLQKTEIIALAVGAAPADNWWSRLSYKLIPEKIRSRIKYRKLPGEIEKSIKIPEARKYLSQIIKELNLA